MSQDHNEECLRVFAAFMKNRQALTETRLRSLAAKSNEREYRECVLTCGVDALVMANGDAPPELESFMGERERERMPEHRAVVALETYYSYCRRLLCARTQHYKQLWEMATSARPYLEEPEKKK